jgi:hypothetical protein
MLVAIVFSLLVLTAGYATLRLFGLAKGAVGLGLLPAAGLATTAVVATWSGLLRAPPPLPGILVVACSLCGCLLLLRDRDSAISASAGFVRQHPGAAGLLAAGALIPIVCLGIAFAGLQAPLSPHDGAFHVETTDAFRRGAAQLDWYPPGLAALFGGALQVLPWVDTAAGGYGLGLGLSLLAPVAVFGLGVAIWRNLVAASAAAVLVGLTYIFPYYPQVWSGWPQLLGLLLVIGLWTVAAEYVERPAWRGAALAGLLVGAMVIVHGTELYTSAIVLVILALASWRRINWLRLPRNVALAVAIAVVCAAPYLPALLHWAGAGGAYQVGLEDGAGTQLGARSSVAAERLAVFTLDALGVDLPVRLILIAAGVIWALKHRTGRILMAVATAFVVLAVVSSFLTDQAVVRTVYAVTYPWSLPFRHMTVAAVPLALLGGGGCVALSALWRRASSRLRGGVARRATRLARLLVITWLVLGTWAASAFLAVPRGLLASFSPDDAAAMAWLRQHARPDEVLANDGFADAGIWAPYKADVRILEYRSFSNPSTPADRELVKEHVAELDRDPAAAAAGCRLNVRYVYHGAQNSAWQPRQFPPLEALRASAGLEEVFSSGDAVVFRVRLAPPCS